MNPKSISQNYRFTPHLKCSLRWQTHVNGESGWRLLGQHVSEEIAYRYAKKARTTLAKETRVVSREDHDFIWPDHKEPLGIKAA